MRPDARVRLGSLSKTWLATLILQLVGERRMRLDDTSNFHLTLARGATVTCAEAVRVLLTGARRWEARSAGKGSKGERWYGWAWLATACPRHHLLVRRHIKTGELAFHYCYVPEGRAAALPLLVRAAGLRWPVEEDFLPQGSRACCMTLPELVI